VLQNTVNIRWTATQEVGMRELRRVVLAGLSSAVALLAMACAQSISVEGDGENSISSPVPIASQISMLNSYPTSSIPSIIEEVMTRQVLPPHVEIERMVMRKMTMGEFARFGGGSTSEDRMLYVVAITTFSPFSRADLFGDSGMDLSSSMFESGTAPITPVPGLSTPDNAASHPFADESGLTSLYFLLDETSGTVLGRGVIDGYFWKISDLESEFPPLP
jgi:hypothetical protein